jgi:hypothetical protein
MLRFNNLESYLGLRAPASHDERASVSEIMVKPANHMLSPRVARYFTSSMRSASSTLSLVMKHQLGERSHVARFRPQRVRDEPSHVVERERLERDLLDTRPSVSNPFSRPRKRVIGVDFIGAICAEQEEAPAANSCFSRQSNSSRLHGVAKPALLETSRSS